MGFTDVHIREALRVLNVSANDTNARSVSRCATWMIDNPLPQDATMPRFQTASSLRLVGQNPGSSSQNRAMSDLRHYLRHDR